MSTIRLLVNPTRSRRPNVDDEIIGRLATKGIAVEPLSPVGITGIAPAITEAADAGMDRLLIAGGDGLIHHALPALAGSDIAVGIIGVGTGNDFARGLGLPTDLPEAIHTALGPASPVDLVTRGDGTFAASVVTGGFSGTVNARANTLRFPPGQQRYTVATLLELPRLHTVGLRLTVDGTTHELDTTLFAVANTRYFGGGMAICPDATPTDGMLDVTVIGPTSRVTLARVLPTVFSGRHVNHPAVTTYRGERIEIDTEADLWADGEPFARNGHPSSRKTFTVARGALRVASNLD